MTQFIVARAIQSLPPPADVGQTEGASDSLNDIKHLLTPLLIAGAHVPPEGGE